METTVLVPLNSLETSLNKLITSLTTTNTFSGATSAAHEILSADEALTSALTTLKQHQDNYNTILRLKSEAEHLRNQIKDTIRTCDAFRNEIGQINATILEESDDEDDSSEPEARDIDYDTLLSFAARIGKHNAAAAREAEQEMLRRRAQATKNKSTSRINGDTDSNHNSQTQTATQESQAALSAINEALTFQRTAAGMAFPAPDHLRMGVLGQLQLLREQEGEDAVEKEVERMIRASETVIKQDEPTTAVEDETFALEAETSVGRGNETVQPKSQQAPVPPPPPPKEQKKVSLDFDEFDSDEDD